MALSDFVNGYTSVPFFFTIFFKLTFCRCSTKNVVLHKKLYWVNKKNISYKSYVAHQNYVGHKKCFGNKLCDTKKRDSCWLDMFTVGHKRNTCWQKKVHVVSKYMFYRLEKFCVARKILWSRKNIKIDVYKWC